MPTPHNSAAYGDFAKVVLMPGDPLRSKWIAETFLTDIKLVNNVRGIQGYTGFTKNGKRISVMASGMGLPSIGIYSYELYRNYGVETIFRIGTCGAYSEEVKVGDIILSQGACTNSSWANQFDLRGGVFSALGTFEVLEAAVEEAKKANMPFHCGNTLSSDIFYDTDPNYWRKWADLGVLGVEMEAYALYSNAARLHKNAMVILTASDSFVSDVIMTPEERQTGLVKMIELAIATAERFA